MDTTIIEKLSEETGGILRRMYILAQTPADGLSTHHASIDEEHAKMLQPTDYWLIPCTEKSLLRNGS